MEELVAREAIHGVLKHLLKGGYLLVQQVVLDTELGVARHPVARLET